MKRIIVGITGATGTDYGIKALMLLRECQVETHLVVSRSAERVLALESSHSPSELHAWADRVY
ncbi:MAG: aromatic acid decarboxylase, partial [Rikenellaceae bacterium]|nr:aromatic acid decarboxylase [Rikenellaceae bacterium]